MYKDLIARKNVLKALRMPPEAKDPYIKVSDVIKAINEVPIEMSVRDPVRCKECKYLIRGGHNNLCTNDNGLDEPLLYDFCSSAEREYDD